MSSEGRGGGVGLGREKEREEGRDGDEWTDLGMRSESLRRGEVRRWLAGAQNQD